MNTYSIILALINFASIVFIALAIMRLAARVKALNDRIKSEQLMRMYQARPLDTQMGISQLRAQIVKLDEIIAKKDAKLLKRGIYLKKVGATLVERVEDLHEAYGKIDEHEKTIESLSVTSDALSLENEQLKYCLGAANNVLRSNGFGTLHIAGIDPNTHPSFKCDTVNDISLDNREFHETVPIVDKEIIRTSSEQRSLYDKWLGSIRTPEDVEKPKITLDEVILKQREVLNSETKEPIKAELRRLGPPYAKALKPEQYEEYYTFLDELPEKDKKS